MCRGPCSNKQILNYNNLMIYPWSKNALYVVRGLVSFCQRRTREFHDQSIVPVVFLSFSTVLLN